MLIALVTPHFAPSSRGNSITVQRLRAGLKNAGFDVEVRSPEGEILSAANAPRSAGIVHGFHARQAGPAAAQLAAEAGCPLVVTMTGTDFNEDLVRESTGAVVHQVLDKAAAVIMFTEACAASVLARLPELQTRLRVIPQAPFLRDWSEPRELPASRRPDAFTLLHVAGIRPVKNNLFPIGPVERLRGEFPGLRLLFMGPVIDRPYAERLFSEIRRRSWTSYAGDIRHAEVPALLAGGDAVLNTSRSEGGTPNALLEAMWWGRPVLAADIEGNRELISDGRTGLLYDGEAGFEAALRRLVSEPGLGQRMAVTARREVRERFSPADELRRHVELYRTLAGGKAL